jgi:carbamoyl-phosphate synthase small subunit
MGNAYLILEDGTVFCGKSIGSQREVISEVVFNTSMTGYLEVLTDPSYAGQALVMTYPLIGNYGISIEDMESSRAWPDAFIVRELSRIPSNFRSEDTIQNFLQRYDIPGISGIDTRALTILLREKGTMNGLITTNEYSKAQIEDLLPKIRAYTTGKVVEKVTCAKKYEFTDSGDTVPQPSTVGVRNELSEEMQRELYSRHFRVALLDFGAKRNIARSLVRRGCRVTVYPAHTSAEEILNDRPDGIMLSNGPGDPKECTQIIEEVRKLYHSDVPIFAICLGHQLMALATGGDTYKMKYGHRGGNHPVKDLKTGRVYISSQNHGYVVDVEHIDPSLASPAFSNVNDGTNEGLVYLNKNIFTVQFHPEACPGPQDSGYLFDRFLMMMNSQSAS